MEWDPTTSTTTTLSPLKRSLFSSQDHLKSSKKSRISLSLSKSRNNKKDLDSVTTTLSTLTTDSPNSPQQQSEKKEEEEEPQKYQKPSCQQQQKQEPIVIKVENKLEEYACPICEIDLTNIKFSYLRQNHVESCISSSPTIKAELDEEILEFDDCIFCAKKLSHFNSKQRQVHLNNCLDEIKPEEEEVGVNEGMFAGQHIPFLETLEICPVCHEITPFISKTLKQKIQHTKQCAKQNKLALVQLLKKFQWIGWGHLPVANTTTSTNNETPATPPPPPSYIPNNHRLIATSLQDIIDLDDDFSGNVILHKTNYRPPKLTREEDVNDEELQTVLAISKSMSKSKNDTSAASKKKKLGGIRPSDERDWNSANIWSMEESRKQAIIKLDELLFTENELNDLYIQSEREKSVGYLEKSRLCSSGNSIIPTQSNIPFWNLASNNESNWDETLIFVSLFLRE
jgi:hypothetical protein